MCKRKVVCVSVYRGWFCHSTVADDDDDDDHHADADDDGEYGDGEEVMLVVGD